MGCPADRPRGTLSPFLPGQPSLRSCHPGRSDSKIAAIAIPSCPHSRAGIEHSIGSALHVEPSIAHLPANRAEMESFGLFPKSQQKRLFMRLARHPPMAGPSQGRAGLGFPAIINLGSSPNEGVAPAGSKVQGSKKSKCCLLSINPFIPATL